MKEIPREREQLSVAAATGDKNATDAIAQLNIESAGLRGRIRTLQDAAVAAQTDMDRTQREAGYERQRVLSVEAANLAGAARNAAYEADDAIRNAARKLEGYQDLAGRHFDICVKLNGGIEANIQHRRVPIPDAAVKSAAFHGLARFMDLSEKVGTPLAVSEEARVA